MRDEEAWCNDNWFVSPWNYLKDVTKSFTAPKSLTIHDVTLRDGEQQGGVIFTREDKIRIAEKLAELGVHRMEAGWPVVSPEDEAAIREIVKRRLGPKIFCATRCIEDDFRRAADCGVDGVMTSVPGSRLYLETGLGWSREKAIEIAIKGTNLAHQLGLYVIFSAVDGTRTELSQYLNMIKQIVHEGHIDSLCFMDTKGCLSPEAAVFAIRKLKEIIQIPLEAHFHNDLGLSVANTIKAVLSGVDIIHTTVNGIGERAGNTPMEETVIALLTLYGIDSGLRYEKLHEVSKLVEELSGVPMVPNRSIVGDRVGWIESGIPVEHYRKISKEAGLDRAKAGIFTVHHGFVGNREPHIVLGKKSGRGNILIWAERLGIELSEEELGNVLIAVKSMANEKRGVLTEGEFRKIVREVKESA